jgi:hypothetical protein
MDGRGSDSEPNSRIKESGKESGIHERAVLLLGESTFLSETSVNISNYTVSHPRK